ncbi:UTP--glucose-1-phosphate uridylyltransferase GalU [Rheinheimera sp. WS51]|uniref:UTP--glucose-1-phosphate uridylyltransferase GalU n=1 Tax=Rheinheimera sp. WS51 TaxID=3425886 RepID=UPI003D91578A
MTVLKAVIPVAGLGTRMLPATKAIPKEMLPIVDKPLIQYVVDECIAAGIKQIVLVTHSSKNSIENHFDKSFELESMLEKRVKRQLLDEVQAICPKDVTIMQVRQGEAKGLGHAVLCALPVVGNAPFAVLLPDVIVDGYDCNLATDNLSKMVQLYNKQQVSQIMVEPVPKQLVSNYGIADVNGETLASGQSATITNIVEKPAQADAPSNLSVVGRYVFNPAIWDCLKRTPVGAGDEIQLTDAIALLMQQQKVEAHHISGRSHDCGNKLGYIQAFVEYAMRDKILGADVTQILKGLSNEL